MTSYESKRAAAQDKLAQAIVAYCYVQKGTSSPQRPWVGLTDEEIDALHGSPLCLEHSGELRFVRAIEAKLKEKNT
jgi:hypothetical protein